ncbi:RelA/SpoT domain-containing protein [Moritella sp. 36]|uniref:RelA/SpoT domain-containing protein n=1 Tax=unclassified Moritella TaxID=2637987 RepID=UPI001BAE2ACC|nr:MULTISPECIES: RelA/SpoT domain-containing protein [unclassified Moritella]QUM79119.1 RelA/SpoT domain-containing protein [Moritella sp. 5]QUM87625.1 RelA/SpoT domain-containing protein [Moritella sp. 36]
MYSFLRTSLILVLMLAGKAPLEAATMLSLSQTSNNGSATNRVRTQISKDLAGLYQLSDISSSNIMQPYSDFDSLYSLAESAQDELATLTQQIALMSQTSAVIPAIKSIERAKAKIANKHDGAVEKITDLARSSLVAKNSHELLSAYELLEQETDIIQVKNRFNSPKQNGYRDINLLVRLPKTQMIVEVQLHVDRIEAIKNGPEHDNYAKIQEINHNAKQQQREISEIELFKVAQLKEESSNLYQVAWQQQLMVELKTSFKQMA